MEVGQVGWVAKSGSVAVRVGAGRIFCCGFGVVDFTRQLRGFCFPGFGGMF